jgi:hypothetical protein
MFFGERQHWVFVSSPTIGGWTVATALELAADCPPLNEDTPYYVPDNAEVCIINGEERPMAECEAIDIPAVPDWEPGTIPCWQEGEIQLVPPEECPGWENFNFDFGFGFGNPEIAQRLDAARTALESALANAEVSEELRTAIEEFLAAVDAYRAALEWLFFGGIPAPEPPGQ